MFTREDEWRIGDKDKLNSQLLILLNHHKASEQVNRLFFDEYQIRYNLDRYM